MNKITAIPAKFVIGDAAMQLVNDGISFKLNMNKGHLPGDTLGYQWKLYNIIMKIQKKIKRHWNGLRAQKQKYTSVQATQKDHYYRKILKVKSVIKIADAWKKV